MPKAAVNSLSPATGDYLKAIWLVAGTETASTNVLAAHLGITAPSVSGMLARLQEQGLVAHERYKGAQLTAQGEREALRLLRRHRLIETFMLEQLGYRWDEVHEEAERLEHAVSERFTERLAALLGNPSHDPHGDPIPTADGSLPATPNTPLSDLEPGQALRVFRLKTQEAQVLSYLAELKLHPGQQITVSEREPLGGLLHVRIADERQVLSKDLAVLIEGEIV